MNKSTAILFFILLIVAGLAIAFGDHAIVEIKKAGLPPFHQPADGFVHFFGAGPVPPQWLMSVWPMLSPLFWCGFGLIFVGGGVALLFQRAVRVVWVCIFSWTILVTPLGLWLGLLLIKNFGFPD